MQITTVGHQKPHFAIGPQQAALDLERFPVRSSLLDRVVYFLSIFRMHSRQKSISGKSFFRSESEQFPSLFAHPRLFMFEVYRPEREVRGFSSQPHSLVAFA